MMLIHHAVLFFFLINYLFILLFWLCLVLAVACWILSCGMGDPVP